MLRFGFVLLVATSALAAPSYDEVVVNVVSLEEAGVARNTGRANHLTDGLSVQIDGGEISVNLATLLNIINDVASVSDKKAQGLALAQAISVLLARATGIPGDVCIAQDFIEKHRTGNYRQGLREYINHIAKNLRLIVNLKRNPEKARFQAGPRSGCSAGGRIYDYEHAWNAIIAKATPFTARYINEQYCTVRRLYNALNVRDNNIAAVVTATSLASDVFVRSYGPLYNFANAVIVNRNIDQALREAQQALLSCV